MNPLGERSDMDHFVAQCANEFGSTYEYPGASREGWTLVLKRNGPELERRDQNGLAAERVKLAPDDKEWFIWLLDAACTPGIDVAQERATDAIWGARTKERLDRFASYVIAKNIGAIERKPGGLFRRGKVFLSLNDQGLRLVWDLLRLWFWPHFTKKMKVVGDSEVTIYEWREQ